jgi:tight adherence protein C
VSAAAVVLAMLAAAGPLLGLLAWRPTPRRALCAGPAPAGRHPLHVIDELGRRAARVLRLPPEPATQRRVGLALAATPLAAVLAPPLAVGVPVVAVARSLLLQRRALEDRRRAVRQSLPDAVDLLLLGTTAGLGLALTHREVATRLPGPIGEALEVAHGQAERGRPRADALVAALAPHGERAAGLGLALADHLRYGTPLAPELERLGLELRLDRRRAAEEDARKVPVRLLAPLVTCTLPAFALLTVAPLLLASLRQLPT